MPNNIIEVFSTDATLLSTINGIHEDSTALTNVILNHTNKELEFCEKVIYL